MPPPVPTETKSEGWAQKCHNDDVAVLRYGLYFWLVKTRVWCGPANQKRYPDGYTTPSISYTGSLASGYYVPTLRWKNSNTLESLLATNLWPKSLGNLGAWLLGYQCGTFAFTHPDDVLSNLMKRQDTSSTKNPRPWELDNLKENKHLPIQQKASPMMAGVSCEN